MPRRICFLTAVVTVGFLITACSPAPSAPTVSQATDLTACEDPRPQVCTANYDPVCGSLGEGSRKTYANACSACGDAAVSGHRPGACE